MGYHLTTSLARPSALSHVDLKTHTPLLRVKERGLRSYSPNLGRWLSRDPIRERVGYNLYAFCMNGPIRNYDVLGLRGSSGCRIIIWAGHYSATMDELRDDAEEYKRDVCTRHAALTCWGAKKRLPASGIGVIDSGVLPQPFFVRNHPPIDMPIGGSWAGGGVPGWEANVELSELYPYYTEGMTYQDFTFGVAKAVVQAARDEAIRLASYAPIMRVCCCKRITIEVKRMWGFRRGRNPFRDHPRIINLLNAVDGWSTL